MDWPLIKETVLIQRAIMKYFRQSVISNARTQPNQSLQPTASPLL